ncbi:MAG: TlpA family protein disulfide reductase [Congregibacter sp.]
MKHLFIFPLLCVTLIACEGELSSDDTATSGAATELLDQTGSWTFVNYWAKWCMPCIKEIPELNALDQRAGYRVLGVNFDGASGEDLQTQLRELGVSFPTLPNDPAARYGINRPQVLPTTLLLDPDGNLVRVLVGPQTQDSLIAATEQPSQAVAPSASPSALPMAALSAPGTRAITARR